MFHFTALKNELRKFHNDFQKYAPAIFSIYKLCVWNLLNGGGGCKMLSHIAKLREDKFSVRQINHENPAI